MRFAALEVEKLPRRPSGRRDNFQPKSKQLADFESNLEVVVELDRLVPLGSIHYCTYTYGLSTS